MITAILFKVDWVVVFIIVDFHEVGTGRDLSLH